MTSNPNSKSDLQTQWTWLMKMWVSEKKRARETGDYTSYTWFLKEIKKEFSKLYVGFTNEKWIELFDQIFKDIACELKEIVIESKKPMQVKKTPIAEMTDEQLLETYKKGTKWAIDHGQVTDSDKNELGEIYNDDEWQVALGRIEKLEKELQKRGLSI